MPTVYTRTDRKGYFFDYVDGTGKTKKGVRGCTDKRETMRLAQHLEDEGRKIRDGLIDPIQSKIAQSRQSPIAGLIVEFIKTISRPDTTSKYVKKIESRLSSVIDGCGWQTVGQFAHQPATELLNRRVDGTDGNRQMKRMTCNHYVSALKQFGKWLVRENYVTANPFDRMSKLNAEIDRRKRRPLTLQECETLVTSTRKLNKIWQGITAEQRARIYMISMQTGLRQKEIASLTPHSFDLVSTPPTYKIEAACAKNRREDTRPLNSHLASLLGEWLKDYPPDEAMFLQFARKPAWRMTRFDLADAGMPSETVEGIADFHAVGRGSFITNLARAGVPIHTVKELARHSSVTMTERYIGTSMQVSANAVDQPDWQCIGSESSGNDRHNVSSTGFEQPFDGRHKERQIPSKNRGFDIESPFVSAAVTEQANCERGESNPHAD